MSNIDHAKALVLGHDGYLRRPTVHPSLDLREAAAADLAPVDELDGDTDSMKENGQIGVEADWHLMVTDGGRFLIIGDTTLALAVSSDHAIEVDNPPFFDEFRDLSDDQTALEGLCVHLNLSARRPSNLFQDTSPEYNPAY